MKEWDEELRRREREVKVERGGGKREGIDKEERKGGKDREGAG